MKLNKNEGELYIQGGLSKGYLNNRELTNERFRKLIQQKNGELIHQTGDYVKCYNGR